MPILRFYLEKAFEEHHERRVLQQLQAVQPHIVNVKLERCYYVELTKPMTDEKAVQILRWLLKHPQKEDNIQQESFLKANNLTSVILEIGPRLNFSTPFSTNCVNICHNIGLRNVKRIEASVRHLIEYDSKPKDTNILLNVLSDRMTECLYTDESRPQQSFDEKLPKQEPWFTVPLLQEGRAALEKINIDYGLAFGDWDLKHYTHLFQNILKRNPTSVELFDLAQSNSEHSRHWFFRGKIFIDGQEQSESLFAMIKDTQSASNANNTIKFSDNSSAIRGFKHLALTPENITGPSRVNLKETESDLIFTAETHNMPTAVAPFSGATTGTGGRIRDIQGIGRGGSTIAGTAGYCVGSLNIPGYPMPYENPGWEYPRSFADPLKILIDASNGASDYGNKFGEPVLAGFAVSCGIGGTKGSRYEYVKPIMFSGGLGIMNANMRNKCDPQKGMLLVKIGGPVYRIGVGGGAASSVEIQGSNDEMLDFNAVQRGDAEMENKMNRVVRACIEMGENNPILAIHDQGAGGNGNVLKELVEPGFAGAVIFSKEFQLGDPTITALELWAAEYQENNAILCSPESRQLLQDICDRERCPVSFVGVVTGNGYVTLLEKSADLSNMEKYVSRSNLKDWGPIPFDLRLEHVLGDIPKREYHMTRQEPALENLQIDPRGLSISVAVERVLSIVSVGSKRFLTNKVDRCVTGLVAQQQCVGPLHTPLADFALTSVSTYAKSGIATSIGTQPVIGLVNINAMARMTVAEALSNLVFVAITELADVKCSGNWMWAAKLEGEGAKLYDACSEMCAIMKELNVAIDGGKDSLSMAARVGDRTIKSPGTLVISAYAPCPDVTVKITPDLKAPARGTTGNLLWINIEGKFRLGGSALAQAYNQTGSQCPNLLQTSVLKNAFNVTQKLLKENMLLAGHDISEGGLIVTLLEMAFGGLSGINVDITDVLNKISSSSVNFESLGSDAIEYLILFAEETGWVLEVSNENLKYVIEAFSKKDVPVYFLGQSVNYGLDSMVTIKSHDRNLLQSDVRTLFKQWERTSFELEKLQANPQCAIEEMSSLDYRTGPTYSCTANLQAEITLARSNNPIRVAVLREEGVNSDREMISSLLKAKFEVHDVTMSDLLQKKCTLDQYRGIIFPGGFSYADTLGSGKGWAANIMFNEYLAPQFQAFRKRKDSFSLGICNGCQLMCLLGWVGNFQEDQVNQNLNDIPHVALLQNKSERFECRWPTLLVEDSNAIMLKNLKGSVLGCWSAHGEGRFSFRPNGILEHLKAKKCIAIRYVDDQGRPTEKYPMNPNGSVEGIAGICSENGRHLALMPHPERCSEMFQWPYVPHNCKFVKSPWQVMFDNAYVWCATEK